MIPVIKWEIFQRKTSLFWWCVVTAILIAMTMLVYPSIREQAAELNKVMSQLPDSLKSLTTGSTEADISSPIGYLNSQLYYSTLPLILGIFTITLGRALGSRDEHDHTLELLLSRPISRSKLLLAKALSGLLMITILGTVSTLSTLLFAKIVSMDIGTSALLMTSLWTILLVTGFGFVAFTLSSAHQKLRRISIPFAVLISIGGFLITSLSGLTEWLETPAKLFPFNYFDPSSMLNGETPKGLAIYLLALFVSGILIAWYGFRSRDID